MVAIVLFLVKFLTKQNTCQQKVISEHILENTAMMKSLAGLLKERSKTLDTLSTLIQEQTSATREMVAYLKGRDS